MKKIIVSAVLLAAVVTAVAFSTRAHTTRAHIKDSANGAVVTKPKTKFDTRALYWFDVTNTWDGSYMTRDWNEYYTGYDHYPNVPYTVQVKGYYRESVAFDANGAPYPFYPPYIPDVNLYSHP